MQNDNAGTFERITVVDALRGFALFGILITHISVGFESMIPEGGSEQMSIADMVVHAINGIFISGKFFMIFSFLFGLSYFIQMDRAARKGKNFQWRFLWRISILLAFGYLHTLLFGADILIIYATLGVPLVFMYKVSDRTLIALAVLLIGGAVRFAAFGYQKYAQSETHTELSAPTGRTAEDLMKKIKDVAQNGSLTDVMRFNAVEGLIGKVDFQVGISGRAYQTLGLFLLGLVAGRRRYFENLENKRPQIVKLLKRSAIAVAVTLAFAALFGFLAMDDLQQSGNTGRVQTWFSIFTITFYDLFNVSLTAVIISGFILVYQKHSRRLSMLVPYGRMALTNYIMQSVIAVPLFYGFGFGLMNVLTASTSCLVGIGLLAVQVVYSKWWLDRFVYGPLEWLWRSATFLRWQPMLKQRRGASL